MKSLLQSKKGQSLVEIAIIAPILIFIMIGVFEVGYALRSQLVIVQASREAARFASRPDYLDLERGDIGYELVVTHARTSIANQIDYDGFVADSAIVISNIVVDTHQPCDPKKREDPVILSDADSGFEYVDYWPNCDCSLVVTNPYIPVDTRHPNTDSHYKYKAPSEFPVDSNLSFEGIANDVAKKQSVSNCELAKRGLGYNTKHSLIIVEIYFYHRQLLGFPVISNSFTDPVLLHAMTIMRRIESRNQ